MSVLIKGMEMPKGCLNCFVKAGWCTAIRKRMEEASRSDRWIPANYRHDDCPLTKIPPHGRLIDADAINHEDEIWKKKCIPPQVVYNAWVVAGEMPTVIPADMDGES